MNRARDIQTVLKDQVVPAGRSRYGLVIGIDRYENPQLNLRCAREDAQGIYDLMVDPACGLFPTENVRLLLDEQATSQSIRRELGRLRKTAGNQDVVWIYYAGHAAVEESKVYWVPFDADIDDLYSTGLHLADFLHDIQSSRRLVLLDCCHAAAASLQRNRTRAAPTVEEFFAGMHGEGQIVLSACKPSEQSVELDDVRHGAFTHFLIQGLRGEADHRQDGIVDADELWEYVNGRVTDAARKAGKQQTPMRDGPATRDFPLTINPTLTQRKLQLEADIRKHVGWDKEHELTTDEGEWCRNLVHEGPKTDDERAVYRELERLIDGHALIGTIKQLIKIARYAGPSKPTTPRANRSDDPSVARAPSVERDRPVKALAPTPPPIPATAKTEAESQASVMDGPSSRILRGSKPSKRWKLLAATVAAAALIIVAYTLEQPHKKDKEPAKSATAESLPSVAPSRPQEQDKEPAKRVAAKSVPSVAPSRKHDQDNLRAKTAAAETPVRPAPRVRAESFGIVNAPSFTVNEVKTAFETAKEAYAEERDKRPGALGDLSNLARRAMFCESSASAIKISEEIESFFRITLSDARTRSELSKLAQDWIQSDVDLGVLFVATIKGQRSRGTMIEYVMDFGDRRYVRVLMPTSVVGGKVSVVPVPLGVAGWIIHDPAKKIKGYTGDLPVAVFATKFITLNLNP